MKIYDFLSYIFLQTLPSVHVLKVMSNRDVRKISKRAIACSLHLSSGSSSPYVISLTFNKIAIKTRGKNRTI